MIICIVSMCTILYMYIFHQYLGANCVRAAGLPTFVQDFQIEEDGSQDFLIQNVSGSTAVSCFIFSFRDIFVYILTIYIYLGPLNFKKL